MRLAPDGPSADAGNLGFRAEEPFLRYVGTLNEYLNWDGRENLADWIETEGQNFQGVRTAHDSEISALFNACKSAHAALAVDPTLRAALQAAWMTPKVSEELFGLAAERIINNSRNIGALVEHSERWSAAFDAALEVARALGPYKALAQAREHALATCDKTIVALRESRKQIAGRYSIAVAMPSR